MLKKVASLVSGTFKGLTRSGRHPEKPQSPAASGGASPTTAEEALAPVPPAEPAPSPSHPNEPRYRRAKTERRAAKSDWEPSQFEVSPMEGKGRFHDFDLPETIMRAIFDLGFQYCTPIQTKTLTTTLSGVDLIGQAQTGTGKTAAFLVAVMTRLLVRPTETAIGRPRALVIAPTRELVMQIAKDGESLARHSGIKVVAVFGGMDYERQQQTLEQGPADILVATPGRLLDFQRRGVVDLSRVEAMVIDEADRMLDMGFIPDVRRIVQSTQAKEKRQTLMFSATITTEVRRLASQWCVNPIHVEVAPEEVAVDTVRQVVYLATASEKYDILYNMVTSQKLERVLVFANRRDETQRLAERLKQNGVVCDLLSGDVAQKKRMTTLERFRDGKISVLVATDVAGRGIHIDGISHVFNYTLPYEAEDYVHRIGRTGRAGQQGVAISFADEDGAFYLPAIEAYIGRKLPCVQPEESLLSPAPRSLAPPGARRERHDAHPQGARRLASRSRRPRDARSGGGGRKTGSA